MTAWSVFDYICTLVCLIFFQNLFFTVRHSFSNWLFQPWRFTSYWMRQTNLKYNQRTKNIFHNSCSLITISNLVLHFDFKIYNVLQYAFESSQATGITELFSTLSLGQLLQKKLPYCENFNILESEIIDIHTKYLIDTWQQQDTNCLNRQPQSRCTIEQKEINCHQPPMQQLHRELSKWPARYSSWTRSILVSCWIDRTLHN